MDSLKRLRVLNMNLLKVKSEEKADPTLVSLYKHRPEVEADPPIRVVIEEFGDLRVVYGGVMVASAKKAGVKQMWVDVEARSNHWISFKDLVIQAFDGTEMDQELFHPDFSNWHVTRGTGRRLRELLKDLGDVNGKEILVLGCGIGFYCHELVKRGAKVIGIDPSRDKILVAKHLSKVYRMPLYDPDFMSGDFMEMLSTEDRFDAIIWPGPNWTQTILQGRRSQEWTYSASAVLDELAKYTDRLYLELEPDKLSREMSDPSWPVRNSIWQAWKVVSIYDWPLLRYRRREKVSAWRRLLELLRLVRPEDLEHIAPRKCEKCGKEMKFNPCGGFWWCECQLKV